MNREMTRLPALAMRRPVRHRHALPRRLRTGIPATVLHRRRELDGPSSRVAAGVEAAAGRVADVIRNGLLALQRRLRDLSSFLGGRSQWHSRLDLPAPSVGRTQSGEDVTVSVLVLAAAAAFAWSVIVAPAGVVDRRRAADPWYTEPFESRVRTIAGAIAIAEGYYAPGEHDGHSLPHRLNNPGALKKPSLGADALPTWKDTGLVIFPTSEMGWAALRHQVRIMLNGRSRIYRPSDSLRLVGAKYADGDHNWGWNVAAQLGVSPEATLVELGTPEPDTPPRALTDRIEASHPPPPLCSTRWRSGC